MDVRIPRSEKKDKGKIPAIPSTSKIAQLSSSIQSQSIPCTQDVGVKSINPDTASCKPSVTTAPNFTAQSVVPPVAPETTKSSSTRLASTVSPSAPVERAAAHLKINSVAAPLERAAVPLKIESVATLPERAAVPLKIESVATLPERAAAPTLDRSIPLPDQNQASRSAEKDPVVFLLKSDMDDGESTVVGVEDADAVGSDVSGSEGDGWSGSEKSNSSDDKSPYQQDSSGDDASSHLLDNKRRSRRIRQMNRSTRSRSPSPRNQSPTASTSRISKPILAAACVILLLPGWYLVPSRPKYEARPSPPGEVHRMGVFLQALGNSSVFQSFRYPIQNVLDKSLFPLAVELDSIGLGNIPRGQTVKETIGSIAGDLKYVRDSAPGLATTSLHTLMYTSSIAGDAHRWIEEQLTLGQTSTFYATTFYLVPSLRARFTSNLIDDLQHELGTIRSHVDRLANELTTFGDKIENSLMKHLDTLIWTHDQRLEDYNRYCTDLGFFKAQPSWCKGSDVLQVINSVQYTTKMIKSAVEPMVTATHQTRRYIDGVTGELNILRANGSETQKMLAIQRLSLWAFTYTLDSREQADMLKVKRDEVGKEEPLELSQDKIKD